MQKEKVKITGIIRSFTLNIKENAMLNGVKVLDIIRRAIKKKDYKAIKKLEDLGIVKNKTEKHNIIVTVGRSVIAELLAGGTTYTGEINYGALGTDSTAPTNADTTLGMEVFRKVPASQAFEDNVCYVDFFYDADDVDGTFEEFGNFINGTGVVDTGQLFSHIATGGWVKTATDSLFISCEYTIV